MAPNRRMPHFLEADPSTSSGGRNVERRVLRDVVSRLLSGIARRINSHEFSPPIMDPETPAVARDLRRLMQNDLSGRIVIVLTAEAGFINLMPCRSDARGNDIWRGVDRDERRRAGDQGG